MFPRWFTVRKCESPKLVLLTVPYARLMASASARSRKSGLSPEGPIRVQSPRSCRSLQMATGTTAARRFATDLCQIIRQHQLDPNLVKAYAVDFCSVKTLRDATREQVENFVEHLADWAEKDRNTLLCQLNSYMPAKEGAA